MPWSVPVILSFFYDVHNAAERSYTLRVSTPPLHPPSPALNLSTFFLLGPGLSVFMKTLVYLVFAKELPVRLALSRAASR